MQVRLASIFKSVKTFNHPADCYGNVGAASGALLLANAVDNIQQNSANNHNVLVSTANDNGQRSTILVSIISPIIGT